MFLIEYLYFCKYNPVIMKKYVLILAILLSASFIIFSGCAKKNTEQPCNGIGTLSIVNKLDSTISVEIQQTHSTKSIEKDYTLPFYVTGDQPYALKIYGPQYQKDTTFMILSCDNKVFIVTK